MQRAAVEQQQNDLARLPRMTTRQLFSATRRKQPAPTRGGDRL